MIRTLPLQLDPPLSNAALADRLEEIADRLDAQKANEYRIRAYRTAARTLHEWEQPVHEILQEHGAAGLAELPGIGKSLARSLERLTQTGTLGLLEQLRDEFTAEHSFATVAGIGRKTAARIHAALGIETLADLEAAAYDGRLEQLPGIGQKRLRAVRDSLAGRFRPRPRRADRVASGTRAAPPTVAELLDIDEEYRRKAEADRLLRIAPRRFNPTHEAWLPILRTERGEAHYTALYSNTARAHELGTTHDWVVIYLDAHSGGGQWTVITSRFRHLKGRRVIRGREAECAEYYAAKEFTSREPGTPSPSLLGEGRTSASSVEQCEGSSF